MGTLRDLQFALQLKIEELRQRDALIDELELELDTKDELIRRLQEELDRHRTLPGPAAAAAAQIEDVRRGERQTVISEPFCPDLGSASKVSRRSCAKSRESLRLIRAAFFKNNLLKNLDEGEVGALTACMYLSNVSQGCSLVQEGSAGDQAFVLQEGRLNVSKDGAQLLTAEPEDMFGEAALFHSPHTYSVTAQTDCKLWVIDRSAYQSALVQCALSRLAHSVELLKSLPFLQAIPENVLMKLADHMEETHHADGDCIVRQGSTEGTFHIISKGQVTLTETKPGCHETIILAELSEGQWFGEKALWGEDISPVNVMAATEVTCLVIDRWTFKDVVEGSVSDALQESPNNNESKVKQGEDPLPLASSTLSDFQIVRTLGVGQFGHVDLVQLQSSVRRFFAMRVLKKRLILDCGQREHILRERKILTEVQCPFIVRLHRTFTGDETLYDLTEACLGGNLSHLLKDKICLDDGSARFYTACVVEALSFLHHRGVVYRDVKPQNVILDERGYAKLIGSRCLKRLEVGKKTYTFCGTLGYMAPEVFLHKGHTLSADLWALGVFVFELLSGRLPFVDSDPMAVLTASVRGIDQLEFPRTLCKDVCNLIKRLCRSKPSERLGSRRRGPEDIKRHSWFEGFNWEGLSNRSLTPPVIPNVKPPETTTHALYAEESVELCTNWDDF